MVAHGVTVINLGRGSPTRLGATYPPTLRNHINIGLLGIAARRDCPFHPPFVLVPPACAFGAAHKVTRLCCSNPHLTVERCYLLRCPTQSGRSSSAWFPRLHQRRPSELHVRIISDGTTNRHEHFNALRFHISHGLSRCKSFISDVACASASVRNRISPKREASLCKRALFSV